VRARVAFVSSNRHSTTERRQMYHRINAARRLISVAPGFHDRPCQTSVLYLTGTTIGTRTGSFHYTAARVSVHQQ